MLSFSFSHRFTQCLLPTRFSLPITYQKLVPCSIIATIHTKRSIDNPSSATTTTTTIPSIISNSDSSNNDSSNVYRFIRRGTRSPKQMHSRRKWTQEEDQRLKDLFNNHGPRYTFLASQFTNRSPSSIYSRCKIIFAEDSVKKGPWEKEELEALRQLTQGVPEAAINWKKIQQQLPSLRDTTLIQQTWYHSINPQWNRGNWTDEETHLLLQLVQRYGVKNWCEVSDRLGSRSPRQCLEKYRYQITPTHKGHFTEMEDRAILEAVEKHGSGDFMLIKKEIQSQRTPRQISHHYRSVLDPAYDRSPWTEEEKQEFWKLAQTMGGDMVGIRKKMNSKRHVKNMWNQYALMKLKSTSTT